MCTYIYESLCCTSETNDIANQLYSNKNFKKEKCHLIKQLLF